MAGRKAPSQLRCHDCYRQGGVRTDQLRWYGARYQVRYTLILCEACREGLMMLLHGTATAVEDGLFEPGPSAAQPRKQPRSKR